jgi:CRP-like cAMP-binding protein/Zn-dependent protease
VQPSVWQQIHEQLDPLLAQPRVRADVVVCRLETSAGRPYFMAKSPQAGTYVRLTERERQLLELMDGSRTVKQIVLDDFVRHKSLSCNRVLQLVTLLDAQSFLAHKRIPTYALLRQRLRSRSSRWSRWWARLTLLLQGDFSIGGIDPFVTAFYRALQRVGLVRPLLALAALIALAGLFVFHLDQAQATPFTQSLASEAGPAIGLGFELFLACCIVLHELGHALVCKAFGREVRRAGFRLFFGFPAFYVDTSDIWLESRWRRIAVSAAGSGADALVAGLCALLALLLPPQQAGVSLAFAGWLYFVLLLNLFPLLELDGYYILLDLLETPNLRPRSFAFVRDTLLGKLWRRERFSREEVILTTYGLLALGYTAFFFSRALEFWNGTLQRFISDGFSGGNWLLFGLTLCFMALVVGTLTWKLLRLAHQTAGLAERGARILARTAEQVQLRPRHRLLAAIPVLAALPPAQLDAIAAALHPRRFRLGSTIIRQGEPGNCVYLIVDGTAEVWRRIDSAPGAAPVLAAPYRVALLGPGDYFGERALLNQAPRAATVRAVTDLDLLELRADDFNRLIRPPVELHLRMQRVAQRRQSLADLPLFRDLRPAERDLLLAWFREETFRLGQTVVRQGEPGDRFYLIRAGRAEVLRAESGEQPRQVAELGPGEFFGELALLHAAPRNATVRALTPLETWSLSRREFDDLLRRYLGLDEAVQNLALRRLGQPAAEPALDPPPAAVPVANGPGAAPAEPAGREHQAGRA